MFGSFIDDLGGGKFKIYHEHPGYGALDQYLMGLRDKSEVPPMLVVDTGDLTGSVKRPDGIGQSETVSGTRIDISIDDVVRALGERVPAKEPCHMKGAFVIVHPKGQIPPAQSVAKVDTYRKRWETWYDWATDNRGSFDTTLSGTGPGTPTCPAPGAPDAGFPDSGQADSGFVVDAGVVDAGDRPDTYVGDGGAIPDALSAGDAGGGVPDSGRPDEDSGLPAAADGGGGKKPDLAGKEEAGGCSCATITATN